MFILTMITGLKHYCDCRSLGKQGDACENTMVFFSGETSE